MQLEHEIQIDLLDIRIIADWDDISELWQCEITNPDNHKTITIGLTQQQLGSILLVSVVPDSQYSDQVIDEIMAPITKLIHQLRGMWPNLWENN